MSSSVSAAAAAAATAATSADGSDAAVAALVAYLRSEADLAEQKAAGLHQQAAALAAQFGIVDTVEELWQRYTLQQDELPPLDEHGVPKYKGKKRGRKAKPRQRQHNPDRPKRRHTGYTLFVESQYPAQRAANPTAKSNQLIPAIAKQWKGLTVTEKEEWKERAAATHNSSNKDDDDDDDEEDDNSNTNDNTNDGDADLNEEVEEEAEEEEDAAPPARRRKR